jgi:hypothetical protein
MRLRRVGARALDRRITNRARILVRIASAASRLTCADADVLSVRLSSEWSALPACQTAPHDHLAGKFHPVTAKLEITDGACVETTQSAVEIAELRPEKDTTYETQERIAQPTMERGHGLSLSQITRCLLQTDGNSFCLV